MRVGEIEKYYIADEVDENWRCISWIVRPKIRGEQFETFGVGFLIGMKYSWKVGRSSISSSHERLPNNVTVDCFVGDSDISGALTSILDDLGS